MASAEIDRVLGAGSHYVVLGVGRTASAAEVKRAFRDAVRKVHPDKTGDERAAEATSRVNNAYETLGDVAKKASYDSRGGAGMGDGGTHTSHAHTQTHRWTWETDFDDFEDDYGGEYYEDYYEDDSYDDDYFYAEDRWNAQQEKERRKERERERKQKAKARKKREHEKTSKQYPRGASAECACLSSYPVLLVAFLTIASLSQAVATSPNGSRRGALFLCGRSVALA